MTFNLKSTRAVIAAALAAFATPVSAAETDTPIKVLLINSNDGDFIATVFGTALVKAGYKVKYVPADYVASYTAVQNGDIDVSLAAWETTGKQLIADALASGKAVSYGPTGVKVTEGWWYPAYLTKDCPGLPKWEALKSDSCVKALATADTAPLGQFVDAPADWGSGAADVIKKLDIKLQAINSGSPAALLATLKGANDRQQPIMGWGFKPHYFFQKAAGDFVELPGFHKDLEILKLAYAPTAKADPKAMEILNKFKLNADDVALYMDKIENDGMTLQAAADDWMGKHDEEWKAWLK